MKKLLLVCLFLFCCSHVLYADKSLTFAWNANTEIDLAGYKIYEADISGGHVIGNGLEVLNIPSGTTIGTYTIVIPPGSAPVTKYWVLTAYDTSGNESGPSNEVSRTLDGLLPASPTGFDLTIVINVTINP